MEPYEINDISKIKSKHNNLKILYNFILQTISFKIKQIENISKTLKQ